MEEHIHTHKSLNQDSLEIGTPSKGGAIKIYFDAANIEDAQKRFNNALDLRTFAQQQLETKGGSNGL